MNIPFGGWQGLLNGRSSGNHWGLLEQSPKNPYTPVAKTMFQSSTVDHTECHYYVLILAGDMLCVT